MVRTFQGLAADDIDSAIKSRSFIIDINLNADQMLMRMKDLLPEIEPGVDSLKLKREALNALRGINKKYDNVQLNFRSLIKAIRIRQMGFKNWKNMIAEQVVGS